MNEEDDREIELEEGEIADDVAELRDGKPQLMYKKHEQFKKFSWFNKGLPSKHTSLSQNDGRCDNTSESSSCVNIPGINDGQQVHVPKLCNSLPAEATNNPNFEDLLTEYKKIKIELNSLKNSNEMKHLGEQTGKNKDEISSKRKCGKAVGESGRRRSIERTSELSRNVSRSNFARSEKVQFNSPRNSSRIEHTRNPSISHSSSSPRVKNLLQPDNFAAKTTSRHDVTKTKDYFIKAIHQRRKSSPIHSNVKNKSRKGNRNRLRRNSVRSPVKDKASGKNVSSKLCKKVSKTKLDKLPVKEGNLEKSQQLQTRDENDDEELELRRLALQSAIRSREHKEVSLGDSCAFVFDHRTNTKRPLGSHNPNDLSSHKKQADVVDSCGLPNVNSMEDNYETVEMVLASDNESENVTDSDLSVLFDDRVMNDASRRPTNVPIETDRHLINLSVAKSTVCNKACSNNENFELILISSSADESLPLDNICNDCEILKSDDGCKISSDEEDIDVLRTRLLNSRKRKQTSDEKSETNDSTECASQEDDEEILRAELLMAIAQKNKLVVEPQVNKLDLDTVDKSLTVLRDVASNKDVSLDQMKTLTVSISANIDQQNSTGYARSVSIKESQQNESIDSARNCSRKKLEFTIKNVPNKLVINLADDSSDSELDGGDKDVDSSKQLPDDNSIQIPDVDAVIRKIRNITSKKDAVTPKAVHQLSKSQQIEYYRLKAEIAKRENLKKATDALTLNSPSQACAESSENNCSDVGIQQKDISKQLPSNEEEERKKSEEKLKLAKQNLFSRRRANFEEQHRLKVVRSQLARMRTELKISETNVAKYKELMEAAVRSSAHYRNKIHTLTSQVSIIKSVVTKNFVEIKSLEAECKEAGTVVIGKGYKLPSSATFGPNMMNRLQNFLSLRKYVSPSFSPIKKGKDCNVGNSEKNQSDMNSDKERLVRLEKEVAKQLKILKSTMSVDSNKQPISDNVIKFDSASNADDKPSSPPKKRMRRLSFLELNQSMTPKLVGDLKSSSLLNNVAQNSSESVRMIDSSLPDEKVLRLRKLAKKTLSVLPKVVSKSGHQGFSLQSTFQLSSSASCKSSYVSQQSSDIKRKLVVYSSPLIQLKCYRFSPYYKSIGRKYSSSSYCTLMDPELTLCRFDLVGVCNDDQCSWQHENDYKMNANQVLVDIASFHPSVAGISDKMHKINDYNHLLDMYVKNTISSIKEQSLEDRCSALICQIAQSMESDSSMTNPRRWRLTQKSRKKNAKDENNDDGKKKGLNENNILFDGPNRCIVQDPDMLVDARYHHSSDESNSISDMLEVAVLDDATNIQLWLKLAYHHLHDNESSNNLDKALNVLSRALEFNISCPLLWSHYLDLYSKKNSEDVIVLCEKATKFCQHYSVWWKYLMVTREITKKLTICDDIVSFLSSQMTGSSLSLDEYSLMSHQMLEIILVRSHLGVQSGQYNNAVDALKNYLGLKQSSSKADVIARQLQANDCCLLWFCFINLVEFTYLPIDLFDPSNEDYVKIVCKDSYYINWSKHKNLSNPSVLLKYFDDGIKMCEESTRCQDVVMDCMPLYMNLINLFLFVDKTSEATDVCNKLLGVNCDNELVTCFLCCINAGCKEVYNFLSVRSLRCVVGSSVYLYPRPLKVLNSDGKGKTNSSEKDDQCVSSYMSSVIDKFNGASQVQEIGLLTHLVVSLMYQDRSFCIDMLIKLICRKCNSNVQDYHQALALYRKLLNRNIQSDDNSNEPCEPCLDDKSRVYYWLCYCYLLELTDHSLKDVCEAYEESVYSIQSADNVKKIWWQYLLYLPRALTKLSGSEYHRFTDSVKRCLMTTAVSFPVPYDTSRYWLDYRFHNDVTALLMLYLNDRKPKISTYHNIISLFPNNIQIVNRALRFFLHQRDWSSARCVSDFFAAKKPSSVSFWKMVISLCGNMDDEPKEVRRMFKKAVNSVPYSATLWKDYILFEASLGPSSSRLQDVLKSCSELGIKVDKFVEFIMK